RHGSLVASVFLLSCRGHHPHLLSLPTRRSSDLPTYLPGQGLYRRAHRSIDHPIGHAPTGCTLAAVAGLCLFPGSTFSFGLCLLRRMLGALGENLVGGFAVNATLVAPCQRRGLEQGCTFRLVQDTDA